MKARSSIVINNNTMELASLLGESTNYLEVYICPQHIRHGDTHVVSVGWAATNNIGRGLGNASVQTFKEYHNKDLTYTYDLSNDCQRVSRKLAQSEHSTNNVYAISFIEETLPSHRYPCTTDVMCDVKITRTVWRINNRMQFIHDMDDNKNNYYYIRYYHSPNVDLRKMQQDFDKTWSYLKKIKLIR